MIEFRVTAMQSFMMVFIKKVRSEVAPSLRGMLSNQRPSGNEKLLMDMAVSNFTANLGILADMINELYMKVVENDRAEAKGRAPLYTKMPELSNIGKMLIQM